MKRVALLLVSLSLAACGGTAQTRRTFPVVVSTVPGPLVTDSGWAVTLSSAQLSLASVRFFSGEALVRRGPLPWRFDPLGWLVPSAWAHPGHYVPGAAMGELLQPLTVDLLAAETPWGTADGVTGTYGSLQLSLGAEGLRLKGTATKGADSVVFDTGSFAPPAAIEGVPFSHVMDTSAGRVRVAVDLAAILSRVDFALVGSGADPLDPASPAFNGFARGVEDSSVYHATWEAAE